LIAAEKAIEKIKMRRHKFASGSRRISSYLSGMGRCDPI
jgi:hypothetical protein